MATQTKDYYGILGVKKTASADDIRKVEPVGGREAAAAAGSPPAKS